MVGLETKPHDLLRVGGTAILVASLGIVAPFGMGFFYMQAISHNLVESIFVAAALVATSVGITARVLADAGVLETRAARVILAAAVVDDILGMIVLAVVSSLSTGIVNYRSITGLGVHRYGGDYRGFPGRPVCWPVVSKVIGCGLGALSLGWKDALRVGTGMIPRGEVGLIVAAVGLNLHTISDAIYTVVLIMSIVTTLVAPPVLRLLLPRASEPSG